MSTFMLYIITEILRIGTKNLKIIPIFLYYEKKN